MRMKRSKVAGGVSTLERLRVRGAGPDPGFRADLRERLLAAAVAERVGAHEPGRARGTADPVDWSPAD